MNKFTKLVDKLKTSQRLIQLLDESGIKTPVDVQRDMLAAVLIAEILEGISHNDSSSGPSKMVLDDDLPVTPEGVLSRKDDV